MIVLAGLVQTYREAGLPPRTVLDISHWQVKTGEHVLLRGRSGSGKTTLFNIIAGLLTPTRGSVILAGKDLSHLREAERDRFRARYIGYVFQTHNLLPFTAVQNVEMPLAFAGMAASERRKQAVSALASVGLGDCLTHRPHQLSTGQRLRVAVARAIVTRPQILLADEPTAALDPETGVRVLDLLQDVVDQTGATLLVASHDPVLSARFGRIVDLNQTNLCETYAALSQEQCAE
jgi:ABC-type lipoprotein export system ATPase subunit